MKGLCESEEKNGSKKIVSMVKEEGFVIGYYLGSFESYSCRDDARTGLIRTYKIWKRRANETKGEYSHILRPWMKAFIELAGGPDVASCLLQDAGKFSEDYDLSSKIDDYSKKNFKKPKSRIKKWTQ